MNIRNASFYVLSFEQITLTQKKMNEREKRLNVMTQLNKHIEIATEFFHFIE